MYDLVEWAAAQPWCDGTIGMVGISYLAMTQLEAAVERPPHLKAILPVGSPGPVRGGLPPRSAQLELRRPFLSAGHRIRLVLTSDDQPTQTPAIMGFRHSPVGTNAVNTIWSDSELLLPVLLEATPTASTG